MRDRVEILAPTFTKDAGGALQVAYAVVETRWGKVDQLSSRERLIAAAERTRIQGRVSLRGLGLEYLDETYRFKVGPRIFEVLGVTNPDGQKVELVCDVVELRGTV
jgi:head-tail adaptor